MHMRQETGKIFRRRLVAIGAIALVGLVAVSSAQAAPVTVGQIALVQPPSIKNDGTIGGENMIATYSADLSNTCLKGAVIHWMQLVTTNKLINSPGFSKNLSFIDPIPGQPIGGTPPQTGNATPFYDITVNKVADFANQAKWIRDGTGTIFGDGPQNLLTQGFFSFTAQTLLVATTAANPTQLLMLGGFQWGFTIGADKKTVALLPTTGISFSNGLATSFNNALKNDFKDYTLSQAICDRDPVLVGFVPEPGTIVLALIGVPGLLTAAARRRRAA
jgi:hypothetical protein